MRLIDADLFLEFINAEMKQNRPDDLHIRNITRVLEDLPTVYDVDKVVEQLETRRNMYEDEADKIDTPSPYVRYYRGMMRGYQYSKEIVERSFEQSLSEAKERWIR